MTNRTQQTVVYRSCVTGGPKWQFYSMPESIVGGADQLAEARRRYRDALAFTLDVRSADLPEIRELAEYEAVKGSGIWIRGVLSSPQLEGANEFFANYFGAQSSDDGKWLFEHTTASGDAVIIPVDLATTLGSVTSQMTSFDAVWTAARVRHSDGTRFLFWFALGGNNASEPGTHESVNLSSLGLTAESPMSDVFEKISADRGALTEKPNYALVSV